MSLVVGLQKESKQGETRVALVPEAIAEILRECPNAIVRAEFAAGEKSGLSDFMYMTHGAGPVDTGILHSDESDVIVGVKELMPWEVPLVTPKQVHYRFFHFPSGYEQLLALMAKKATAIAYEGIEEDNGARPILGRMSEVASVFGLRMADKYCATRNMAWPDVKVAVFGSLGVVGRRAMREAAERGAVVVGFDKNGSAAETRELILCYLAERYTKSAAGLRYVLSSLNGKTLCSGEGHERLVRSLLPYFDVFVIGVAARNQRAPKVLTREMFPLMKRNAFIVDVAVDEGGGTELRQDEQGRSKPTSHADPIVLAEVDGKEFFYCGVPNMPGGIPEMATPMISAEASRYLKRILSHMNPDRSFKKSILSDRPVTKGFVLYQGVLVDEYIAKLFGMEHTPLETLLK